MRFGLLSLCASVSAILACSGATTSSGGSSSRGGSHAGSSSGAGTGSTSSSGASSGSTGGGSGGCSTSQPLAGASYDVSKSRFAFGSQPMEQQAGAGLVRWVGSDGAVAIFPDGSEMASLDANAPENGLAGWNGDDNALFAHVSAYYEAMGVQSCQIAGPSFAYGAGSSSGTGSSSGGTTSNSTIAGMSRAIDGVVVDASHASAQFDVDDQTVYEIFYWPEIPADVVSAAVALHTKLADPSQLAAYKAKLPADAQGDGKVIIHHTQAGSMQPFEAVALYTVTSQSSGSPLFFDANGNPVMLTW